MSNKPVKVGDQKKAWNKRIQTSKRTRGKKPIVNLFEIYCEGANTEPEYFKAFPVNPATRVVAEGFGRQRISLVNFAIAQWRAQGFLFGQKHYSTTRQLWVVFDYDWRGDDNECQDYSAAIQMAQANGIEVAYSNDAFELWILLHYQNLYASTHRAVLYQKLSAHMGTNYLRDGKGLDFAKSLYKTLEPMQKTALHNAELLFTHQTPLGLCQQNPITRVHELVNALNKFKRK